MHAERFIVWPRCPLEASIRADAYALKSLQEYCSGKCILYAWVSRGYVSREHAAAWHGGAEEFHRQMKAAENKMLRLARLAHLPDLDESAASKRLGFTVLYGILV